MSYRVCGNCDFVINNRFHSGDNCPGCDSSHMLNPLDDPRDWEELYREQQKKIVLGVMAPILSKFFQNDQEKIEKWLSSENANFGGASPNKLIENGRGYKVLLWLENQ